MYSWKIVGQYLMNLAKNSFDLTLLGVPCEFGNQEMLETYRFPNHKPFATSYKEFVKKYGYGRSLGIFYIYIPMDSYGDSWNIRTEEIKATYYEDVFNDDIWFEIKPDGTKELLLNLVPFGWSENGHYLFWDITSEPTLGEYDIYLSNFKEIGFKKIASCLYEMIDVLTDSSHIKTLFSPSYTAFPKEFKCLIKIEN